MAEAIFEISGLCFAYGGHPVLTGLDLTLEEGRFHGIVGPNGCGKTTLLDLMARNRKPAAGGLRLMGRELGSYSRGGLARRLALTPQEFAVNFPFSVRETVLMGRHPHIPRFASPARRDLEAVERAMALMGVERLAHKPMTELSGGEKQRAVLARALAQDTPVLLLDEPTSHLDVNHALAVLRAAADLAARGRTVAAVMHDLNLAAAFCDRLAFIKDGRVLDSGPAEQVLNEANLARVFGIQARVGWDDFAGCRTVTFKKDES